MAGLFAGALAAGLALTAGASTLAAAALDFGLADVFALATGGVVSAGLTDLPFWAFSAVAVFAAMALALGLALISGGGSEAFCQ